MCRRPRETLSKDDSRIGFFRGSSNEEITVTQFSDGSRITHFEGPAEDLYTDEFGEEC